MKYGFIGCGNMGSAVARAVCKGAGAGDVLLSDIDGLYTADPHTHPEAELIPVVEEITPEIELLAGGAGSSLGTGGMLTKVTAAKRATAAGVDMIITNGAHAEVLYDIVEGKPVGTRFVGRKA